MNRYVVMVDAGYLLRQSIEIVSQRASKKRAELEITDPQGLIGLLLSKAQETLALEGKELLRVYWYDGMNPGGLTAQQRSLIEVDDVQFRAGTVNAAKQQKGVDSLVVTDLIELTSHHAMSDAVLITGDSDLAIGIELAQRRGVRIAVLGVEDLALGVAHHQSFEITSRADRVGRIGGQELFHFLKYLPAPAAAVVPLPGKVASGLGMSVAIAAAAAPLVANLPRVQPAALSAIEQADVVTAVEDFATKNGPFANAIDLATSRIEATVDRALIHHVFEQLACGALSNQQKIFARQVFRKFITP